MREGLCHTSSVVKPAQSLLKGLSSLHTLKISRRFRPKIDPTSISGYATHMVRSVRWRLILNSLLVTLVAILAVGVVTLLLIDRYFVEQEQQYLTERANSVLPEFVYMLRHSKPEDLKRVVWLTALVGDVRVELLDADNKTIADSGPRDPEKIAQFNSSNPGQRDLQIRLNDNGSILISSIETRPEWLPQVSLAQEPELSISAETPITSISEQSLTIPLQVGDEIIGSLKLSEGPAAGSGV